MYFYIMNISNTIIKLRKSKGWSQKDLALKLNVTQKVVSDYETNKRKPPINRLPLIAKIFGITIDELLGAEPISIKESVARIHKNSRLAQIYSLLDKLTPEEERAILKHIKGLLSQHTK